jgi:hypothetical protein
LTLADQHRHLQASYWLRVRALPALTIRGEMTTETESDFNDEEPLTPHDEIVRLEERIEELHAKIESCRKFILASRIALAGGGIVLTAMLVSAIRFDPGAMAAAVAAFLGGIVVCGSNASTAREAAKELVTAEADRAALIEATDPRVIP